LRSFILRGFGAAARHEVENPKPRRAARGLHLCERARFPGAPAQMTGRRLPAPGETPCIVIARLDRGSTGRSSNHGPGVLDCRSSRAMTSAESAESDILVNL
jgi:hypothetical protein